MHNIPDHQQLDSLSIKVFRLMKKTLPLLTLCDGNHKVFRKSKDYVYGKCQYIVLSVKKAIWKYINLRGN